ncbi:MAG TPA: PilZ domain-containing protein [Candidatus Acidoferrales bacterium]|nr:PilZ domain-containing protein [Candidatus Acidoferrales bacterium]
MHDQGRKNYSAENSSGNQSATGEAERRNADRHTFTASAEVIELSSGARFATRTTDLGPGGCFVDTLLPFPVGATVRVSVVKGKTKFETGGVVVYSQTGLGMGIAFDALLPQQRQALDAWLAELTGGRQLSYRVAAAHGEETLAATGDRAALVRLVQLMISKGILTHAEGASILHDPVY